ncbi:hypothetical protein AAFF_G00151710 [Aldrovandia affinis]|uniref:Uncharacterized protein n=1 Tax=Aldrovandia affinis TaxID=143900 RepID=A0AAD7RRG7_9TELE|nr:hypothetical protein AAFF_G00151710 [Aldrovandia affinis]
MSFSRGVHVQHAEKTESCGRLSAVHFTDRSSAVPVLFACGYLPIQQFSVGVHLLRRSLHSGGLPANPDQPTEQRGLLVCVPRESLRRLPIRPHCSPSRGHEFHWLRAAHVSAPCPPR